MKDAFSPLADGLMSYLASRAHDWESWQIEENDTLLKISLLISHEGALKLLERTVPLGSSPSQVLDEMLEAGVRGEGSPGYALPQEIFPKLRNSLGRGAVQ